MAEIVARSSSCQRESTSENKQQVAQKIGCMSGIFHLLHNHHLLVSRKRLTTSSGKKDKKVISPSQHPSPSSADDRKDDTTKTTKPSEDPPSGPDLRRLSCDVPRSPTIPQEIRRSNSVKSPEKLRRPPALVARLMGLDEIPSPSPSPESSAEKRRKLLGELQKCDEDLKALKKIVEAMQTSDDDRRRRFEKLRRESLHEFVLGGRDKGRASSEPSKDLDGGDSTMEEKRCSDVSAEQPSPVSVLDEISSSPNLHYKSSNSLDQGGYWLKDDINGSFFHRIMVESLPRLVMHKGGGVKHLSSWPTQTIRRRLASTVSKGMIETVNEVWKDGLWEERWELRRMGAVLEKCIFGELIEEMVRELGCFYKWSLPLDACRKRLRF